MVEKVMVMAYDRFGSASTCFSFALQERAE